MGEGKFIQVNIRLKPSELKQLLKASAKKWPGAKMTRAAIVLSLAKEAANQALKNH